MLPLVASMTVCPGLSSPDFSAASITPSARRSLTEPSGLKASILTNRLTPGGASRLMRTTGVLPIVSRMFSYLRPIRASDRFAYAQSVSRQHQHLGLARQRCLRDDDGCLAGGLDREVVADLIEEAVERIGVEVVHGQDQSRPQRLHHLHRAGDIHGVAAVDRHHHDVELADLGDLLVGQRVMQVAEMADAHAGQLEDEDRVAVRDVAAAPVADVGRDVADAHVRDGEVMPGRTAVGVPAAQHVLDVGIGQVGVVRGVRPVHRGDMRRRRRADVVVVVGGDLHRARALDQPGRMADEGEARLRQFERYRAEGRRLDQARRLRHGEASVDAALSLGAERQKGCQSSQVRGEQQAGADHAVLPDACDRADDRAACGGAPPRAAESAGTRGFAATTAVTRGLPIHTSAQGPPRLLMAAVKHRKILRPHVASTPPVT